MVVQITYVQTEYVTKSHNTSKAQNMGNLEFEHLHLEIFKWTKIT